MPVKKIRCSFKDCSGPAQRIVGDCAFCQGHFCGKHRLLEDHKCEGLEDVSTNPANPAQPANGVEWWQVGLFGLVAGDYNVADTVPTSSARRKRTRRTPPNSTRNGRKLSAVSKKITTIRPRSIGVKPDGLTQRNRIMQQI
ncbi:hypothetical protein DL546_003509 [Coniochaeta pulveracea]|uniref:AN1-type domain-containing protein n=1 Tax=Coniochaeta pulveracea TaxID=177199 RepID=A0A420Y9D3_9PEZI|nr:hypothetical protein DL546_003509 [Coniochaeta pulveracea]